MWTLKYIYQHKDCFYSPKVKKLNLVLYGYPINNYVKGKYLYISALHIVEGKLANVKEYIAYLKKHSYKTEIISDNVILTLMKISKNKKYYRLIYNPLIFYSHPMIHKQGIEYIELSSWDKQPLSEILIFLRKSKNTQKLKLLSLKQEKLKEIFLAKTVRKLTSKQREAFELAKSEGYYSYPRKINLKDLAKLMKISKSNFHEILRRAESNVLKYV